MNKILIALIAIGLIACDTDYLDETATVGSSLLNVNENIILVDTMSLRVSTINFDSLQTSSSSRFLIGGYSDPLIGEIQSESYFEFSPSSLKLGTSDSDTYTPNYVFDSLVMILKNDRYYYGDTTQILDYSVHKLTQKVKSLSESSTALYNNTQIAFDSQSIGTKAFYPRPKERDSISIRITDTYGNDLFQKLKNFEFSDINQFHDYFKGLVIRSGANSKSILGYKSTSVLRMYYSINDDSDENDGMYKDFSISDIAKQYNRITSNKTGTSLANLPGGTSFMDSAFSNHISYIQSGTGLACRIDFPNLKTLNSVDHKGIIVDARLVLKPVKNSHNKRFPLRDSLRIYQADNLNRISKKLVDASGEDVLGRLIGEDNEFGDNIYYQFSIGSFLNKELQKESVTSSLIITLPDYQKTVNRIALGGQHNTEEKVELKIYYLPYK
jgi:hypothetical protein